MGKSLKVRRAAVLVDVAKHHRPVLPRTKGLELDDGTMRITPHDAQGLPDVGLDLVDGLDLDILDTLAEKSLDMKVRETPTTFECTSTRNGCRRQPQLESSEPCRRNMLRPRRDGEGKLDVEVDFIC